MRVSITDRDEICQDLEISPKFGFLRSTRWTPSFFWASTLEEAARAINRPHEDYPNRVPRTVKALEEAAEKPRALLHLNSYLLDLHLLIFPEFTYSGSWRRVDVRVGAHIAPHHQEVFLLMRRLVKEYRVIDSLSELLSWYYDFNTIHPFQDGNGRVSGVIVATRAHQLQPQLGWLAPGQ